MTTLSKAQLREMAERFVGEVAGGAHVDDAWKEQMIDASTPELPDEPTPEQIDAWNEIIKMITDETVITEMRAEMASMWNDEIGHSAYAEASDQILAKARQAIEKGEQPTSTIGITIAREWLRKIAKVMKRDPDETFIEWARKHHARSSRYRELLAILRGDTGKGSSGREWLWITWRRNSGARRHGRHTSRGRQLDAGSP
jgi:hypothetical protein